MQTEAGATETADESASTDADARRSGRRAVRGALAVGLLAGLAHLATVPLLRPDQVGLATDVYFHAARAVLEGASPYGVAPPGRPGYYFLYPPAVVLAFVPHALTGSELGAYALQTALNLATAGALAVLLVRAVERTDATVETIDRLLVGAFAVASVHSVTVLVMGQVNLQLALAVAVGAVLAERGRGGPAGVAFGLAASVKLFPAAVGAWLLRRRERRAIAAATATGLGAFALGLLALGPARLRTFLTETLPSEGQADAFAGGLPPESMFVTVRRPIAAALPSIDPDLLALVAIAVVLPVVLACLREVSTRTGRQTALLATLLGTLAVLPLEPFYFSLAYYPLVPLLYDLPAGRGRRLVVAGTAFLSVTITYPVVAGALAVAPLSPAGATAVDQAAQAVFRVAQPPLVGIGFVLAGCVVVQHRLATE